MPSEDQEKGTGLKEAAENLLGLRRRVGPGENGRFWLPDTADTRDALEELASSLDAHSESSPELGVEQFKARLKAGIEGLERSDPYAYEGGSIVSRGMGQGYITASMEVAEDGDYVELSAVEAAVQRAEEKP